VPEGVFQHIGFPWSRSEWAVRFLGAAVLLFAMPNTQTIAHYVEQMCASRTLSSRFHRLAVPSAAGVLLVAALSQMQKVSAFLYFRF
jgi:hypothetical protein